jgi:hypothetical protein
MIVFKDGETEVFVGPYDTHEKAVFVAKRLSAAGVGETEIRPIEWATSWQEIEAAFLAKAEAEAAVLAEAEAAAAEAKPKRTRTRKTATATA